MSEKKIEIMKLKDVMNTVEAKFSQKEEEILILRK